MDVDRRLRSAEENRWGEMTGDSQPVLVNHDLAVYCHCTLAILLVAGVILYEAPQRSILSRDLSMYCRCACVPSPIRECSCQAIDCMVVNSSLALASMRHCHQYLTSKLLWDVGIALTHVGSALVSAHLATT